MPKRIEALAQPELLNWARKSIGYDVADAAKKIGVKPDILEEWESGNSRPSIPQLRKAAKAYKRPLAVFYLPKPPNEFDALRHDFRRLPKDQALSFSSSLNYLLRRIHQKREVAVELSEAKSPKILKHIGSINLDMDPEVLGDEIRGFLGVPLGEQFAWKDKYEALKGWTTAIEITGILVFQSSEVPSEEMRGFSINDKPHPIIFLNAKDSQHGRLFTLIHELGHLLLNNGGICDLREYDQDRSENQRTERFCNQIAASTLVPLAALQSIEFVKETTAPRDWEDWELITLSQKFNVSVEVVVRRLLTLGKTTQRFYESKRRESLEHYAAEKKKPKKPIPFPPFRKAVRDNGRPFTKTLFNAYYKDRITVSDLSEYLDVRAKHIPKIEQVVMSLERHRESDF